MPDKKQIKEFWKRGTGEIIGFLCVSPFLILMVGLLVSIFQVGAFKERLDYFAYKECRTYLTAGYDDDLTQSKFIKNTQKQIKSDAKEEFSDTKGITIKDVEIELLDTSTDSKSSGSRVTVKGSKKKDEVEWLKGEYVRLSITADVEAPLIFMSGQRTSSIVMMLEYPANEGGDYPWFREMG